MKNIIIILKGLVTSPIARALFLAIITPVLVTVQQSLDKGDWHIDCKLALMTGLGAGIAYLLKQLFGMSSKNDPTKS